MLGLVLFSGMTQELVTTENWGEAQRGAAGAGEEEEEEEGNMAGYGTGTPLPTPQPERCLTAGPI